MPQKRIPGTEQKRFPAITSRAEKYRKKMRKRMEWGVEERDAKLELIAAMKERGLTEYVDMEVDPPIEVVLSVKEDVKVNDVKAEE